MGEASGPPPGPRRATPSLLALLECVGAQAAALIALEDEEVAVSYGNLLGLVSRLAEDIGARVPEGRAVALACPEPAWQVVSLLGAMAARRVALVVDTMAQPGQLEATLRSGPPAAVLAPAGQVPAAFRDMSIPVIAPDRVPAAATSCGSAVERAAFGREPALILRDQGPAGDRPALVIGSEALLRGALAFTRAAELGPTDRVLVLNSPGGIDGITGALAALLAGARLRGRDPMRGGVDSVADLMRRGRVTVLGASPAMLRALLRSDSGRDALASLRLVRLAGGPMFYGDIAPLRRLLPAGACVQVACSLAGTVVSQWFVSPAGTSEAGLVPMGHPLAGSRLALSPAREPGQEDQSGELLLGGDALPIGRWVGGRCVPLAGDQHWLRTGLRCSVRTDGLLTVAGWMAPGNEPITPWEIEALLRSKADVRDAAVVRLADPQGDSSLVAFVACGTHRRAELTSALAPWLAATGPLPLELHVVDEIPKRPDGEPCEVGLEQLRAAPQTAPSGGPAATRLEQALAGAWGSVLDCASYEADRPFAAVGGDSLKLIQLALEMERRLGEGTALPLEALGAEMRPSEMLGALTARLAARRVRTAPAGVALFLPGLTGDEPALARLRTELPPGIQPIVPRYPGWIDMSLRDLSMTDIAAAVFEQVERQLDAPVPVHIVGYSFGGHVAVPLVRLMLDRGTKVSSVCVIDTTRRGLKLVRPGPALRTEIWGGALRKSLHGGRLQEALGIALAQNLARPELRPLLRLLARRGQLPRPSAEAGFFCQKYLEGIQRSAILRSWIAGGAPSPVTGPRVALLRSSEHASDPSPDLGWSEVSPAVSVHHVPGTHHSIFSDENRPVLRRQLIDACGMARWDGESGAVATAA
nr:AMP-binding protein [Roseicella aerolata]